MDLQNEFKDLNLDANLDKDLNISDKDAAKNLSANLPENTSDFSEGDQIIKDLEKRLAEIKNAEVESHHTTVEGADHAEESSEEGLETENEEDEDREPTLLEKLQPFILPICLTLFAVIFAALFLYFFSQSKINNAVQAITNTGAVEQTFVPPPPVPVVVIQEPLTCVAPQFLNEAKDACLDPEPVATPVPEKIGFENGTTTVVNVRFSYDKFNYDNYPRGIYLNKDQIFDGDYEDFKILPTNRAFANDFFFGVDRYTVSLIGSCQFTIDDAQILVSNMRDSSDDQVYSAINDRYFRGKVVKVLSASKPYVSCQK